MNSIDFSEYTELIDEGGFDVKAPVDPQDEFFHAIYISGQQRQNELGITEIPGKLQIRGVASNLDKISLIITHVKPILVKTERSSDNRRDELKCFSYKQGPPPWKGTSGIICGKNAVERATNPFCVSCRAQLIVAGIYLDEQTNKPVMVDKKPIYAFIRAKGVKYGNISDYLTNLSNRDDLEPIITPPANIPPEVAKKFEKNQVNHKRFITVITVAKQNTNYGLKDVFKLETGAKLSTDAVKNILNKSKETLEQFKDKFDWSKNSSATNYSQPQVDESQKFDNPTGPVESSIENKGSDKTPTNDYSFEELDF